MNSRAYISSKAFMPTYIDLSGMGPSFGEGKMTSGCFGDRSVHSKFSQLAAGTPL